MLPRRGASSARAYHVAGARSPDTVKKGRRRDLHLKRAAGENGTEANDCGETMKQQGQAPPPRARRGE